ncbi:hypothetical protein PLEOSDRAFT_1099464 [Pleurotus ostreatus PC15]|uniref:Uncharacterized protein n=1 Tax=Pleurotus ostreatus (strain PC15) TaxID=1137138 RepID=A0A067P2N9_PLEO1|nr:hypothetical protein PLEOSDRAFT_1099464 [Pleurotus ostreatus PC15]
MSGNPSGNPSVPPTLRLCPPTPPNYSRAPSPTASVRAMYARSRPTSEDFSTDGQSSDPMDGFNSIEAALATLATLAKTPPSVPLVSFEALQEQYTEKKDTPRTQASAPPLVTRDPKRNPKSRVVRVAESAKIERPQKSVTTLPNPSVVSLKHFRSRSWSVKRFSSLLNRKGNEGQATEGTDANTPQKTNGRKLSISKKLNFKPLRRVLNPRGIENVASYTGGGRLRRARSLGGLSGLRNNNHSLIQGLEADGIDEATADAIRYVAMMHERFTFEEPDDFEIPTETKSVFDLTQ